MRERNSTPASVGTTARVLRESNRVPRSASRSAMIRDAWDCDNPHSRAAAEKLPSRATRVYSLRADMSFTSSAYKPQRRYRRPVCMTLKHTARGSKLRGVRLQNLPLFRHSDMVLSYCPVTSTMRNRASLFIIRW